jgi:cyclase
MAIRVIVRLDVKGPNLVKGIHLEGLRALGRPGEFARHYYEQGADELIYVDAVASLYGRNSLLEIVRSTSAETFVPLCVGGGLRSIEDINDVLRAGADKVALNTRAINEPEFIREAARRFGSSTIVISIQAMRRGDHYECFTDSGRESTGKDALEWARTAEELGAGELLVTSIDREGTGDGYDLELTRSIAHAVSVPVIACGGAGSAEHVAQAVLEGGADAVCVAGLLHYGTLRDFEMADPEGVGIGHAAEKGKRAGIGGASLAELKAHLRASKIDVRDTPLDRV